MRERFLVCYDYGQGGVWAFVHAKSADEIREKYPELLVASGREEWMSDEWLARIDLKSSYDIGEEPRGLLAEIVKQRRRQ